MPALAESAKSLSTAPHLVTSGLSAFAADPEMVAEFVTESREHLANVEQRLLLIEKDATDLESVNAVFRAIHTIKGLAGFLELKSIQDIAHEVETLLDHARSLRLTLTPHLVDALFEGVDYLGSEVTRVQRHASGESAGSPANNTKLMLNLRAIGEGSERDEVANTVEDHSLGAPQPAHLQSLMLPHDATLRDMTNQGSQRATVHVDDATIRIGTAKLDRLMDSVGELVIAQTLVSHNQHIAGIRDPRVIADLALLHRITEEIQRITTSMRMVPIGLQFQKTARVIRDLSRQVGKAMTLSTAGEETEIDKTIAEELAGPLLHMVRNSVDHGIETTEERLIAGKDRIARIRLAAYHESSQIVIEIADDGRGLSRERILAKAIDRGLVAPGAQLLDSDIYQLIFEPGFSTAEKVTEISGRGVGMDVVRRHVQRLRGRIDIQSEAGVGTTFFLRLPLTLALIEGLIVLVGDSRYILPISSVLEIFCATASHLACVIPGEETINLRDAALPVVRVHQHFHVAPRFQNISDGVLIVTESKGRRFCLFIDEMLGKQEVVVKNLGSTFRNSKGLMGCAILSDGRVGLILDVDGIMP